MRCLVAGCGRAARFVVALIAACSLLACGSEGDDGGSGGDNGQGGTQSAGGCEIGTSAPDCTPCEPGSFCPGGTEPGVLCDVGEWDDDLNPRSPCALQTNCVLGEFVNS